MPGDVTRLRGTSGRLHEREYFVCTVREVELLQAVGEPSSDNALSEGPPKLVWDLEWPCGLTASLQLDQLTQRLTGYLDRSEVAHVFRHLEIEPEDLWLLEQELPAKYAAQSAGDDRSFELWQQEGNDSNVIVKGGLTEGDASCWRDELERGGHAKRHWVQCTKPPGPGAGAGGDTEVRQQLIDRLAKPPQ
ncbi:MAG: hypothetical protein HYX32_02315 [Actinobacteria bacterium]|nr:hypothetical protein [Actinomycetota bacterium]